MTGRFLDLEDDSLLGLVGLPALVGACAAGLVAAAVLFAPISPLALGRAEASLGRGLAPQAAVAFTQLGQSASDQEVRVEALERAAQVQLLELDNGEEGRRLLRLRLALGGEPTELAGIREELAESFVADRKHEPAARQFVAAHDADPEGEEAPELLARAAESWLAADKPGRARVLWNRLMKAHPAHAARANLGLGELELARGRPAAALSPFQAASRTTDAAVGRAARLGLAACYERLGELDGALAELDRSMLPADVRERRIAGLMERERVRGGLDD